MPLAVPSQMSPEWSCWMERTLSLGSPSRMVRMVTRIFFEAVDAAAGGSHPNAAFGVFVEASNDLVGEPVAASGRIELSPGEAG